MLCSGAGAAQYGRAATGVKGRGGARKRAHADATEPDADVDADYGDDGSVLVPAKRTQAGVV